MRRTIQKGADSFYVTNRLMFNFENKRKMKKIVLVCIVAIMATAAQAQIYVGGTLGFSSVKTEK